MAGICAVVSDKGPVDRALVHDMCERIVHRGPSSEALDVDGRVGLGVRRMGGLLDLDGEQQPLYGEDRTVAVVCDGAIANHAALRAELLEKGHRFATRSDLEAIVHLFEERGTACLEALRGSFALGLHERTSGRTLFARDRIGHKPLFWTEQDGVLLVASELRSLYAVPALRRTLDEVALDQFFSLGWIPAPRTIFREIHALPPGHSLTKEPGRPAAVERWFRLVSRPEPRREAEEWVGDARRAFDDAVRSHLVPDAPAGALLTGGVMSAGLVGAMSRAARGRIATFSIVSAAGPVDLDTRARLHAIAHRFDTRHEDVEIASGVVDTVVRVAGVLGQPTGNPDAVTSLLACQALRERADMVMTELGADEVGAGHARYLDVQDAEWYRHVPRVMREDVVKRLVDRIPEMRPGVPIVDRSKRFVASAGLPWLERFFTLSSPIAREQRQELYTQAVREKVELDSALELFRKLGEEQHAADALNRLLCIDLQTSVPDDVLAIADRASMAASLEMRAPFLEHRLVEWMATVPGKLKMRRRQPRWLLERAFAPDLPAALAKRVEPPAVRAPVGRWLLGDLRALREEMLAPERLRRQGFFEPDVVTTLQREHDTGRRDHGAVLWPLLMFQLWARDN